MAGYATQSERIRSVTVSLLLLVALGLFIGVMLDAAMIAVRYQQIQSVLPGIADLIVEQIDSGSDITGAQQSAQRILDIEGVQIDSMHARLCAITASRSGRSETLTCDTMAGDAVQVSVMFRSELIFLRLFGLESVDLEQQVLSRRRLFSALPATSQ